MNRALPSSGGPNLDFYAILSAFKRASGITAIVSLVGLIWTGSNLFGVMENCFSIIFRTRTRSFVWQKLMSILMIIILAVLAPLAVFASSISGSVSALSRAVGNIPGIGLLFGLGGYVVGVGIAFVLFFLIYLIVPNRRINPGDAWRGALFAAVLFEIVNLIFPLYVKGQHSQFGSFAGLLAILVFWFWVLSLIIFLGAELNSYAALGQRAIAGNLPTVLHNLEVHGEVPDTVAVAGLAQRQPAAPARRRDQRADRSGGAPASATATTRLGARAAAILVVLGGILAFLHRSARVRTS
jgi:YihY family inner membrane protein